jgi:hypothetical protein
LLHRSDLLAALAEYEARETALRLELAKQYPDLRVSGESCFVTSGFAAGEKVVTVGRAVGVIRGTEGPGEVRKCKSKCWRCATDVSRQRGQNRAPSTPRAEGTAGTRSGGSVPSASQFIAGPFRSSEQPARRAGLGNLRGAIGEAAFMTGLERNGDVVSMAAYAPLFCNANHKRWPINLINFDSARAFGIPSYYVQKLFSEHRGDVVLPVEVETTMVEEQKPAGCIGVGTWNTAAEFKDIKVTSLDGKTLFTSDFSQGSAGHADDDRRQPEGRPAAAEIRSSHCAHLEQAPR